MAFSFPHPLSPSLSLKWYNKTYFFDSTFYYDCIRSRSFSSSKLSIVNKHHRHSILFSYLIFFSSLLLLYYWDDYCLKKVLSLMLDQITGDLASFLIKLWEFFVHPILFKMLFQLPIDHSNFFGRNQFSCPIIKTDDEIRQHRGIKFNHTANNNKAHSDA